MLHLTQPLAPRGGREGMVLLIVITMLTLFAVVGLSFVYYAEAEATSSSFFRQSESLYAPDTDPELALSLFLNQLIYGVRDDESGVYSSLRGHDMLRTMYGLDYDIDPATGNLLLGVNEQMFNGTGRLHSTTDNYPVKNKAPFVADDYELVNY